VSLHAELVARFLRRSGVDVRVYAPTIKTAIRDWHHILLGRDEDYVIRCYDETVDPSSVSARGCRGLISGWDPDIIIVECYNRLPSRSIGEELLHAWSSGARIVYVIHYFNYDEAAEHIRYLPPGAVAVFDDRLLREVLYPYRNAIEAYTKVIGYPCAEPVETEPYRLVGTEDKFLFFSFGRQPVEELSDYVRVLDELSRRYDIAYYVVRSSKERLPWRKNWLIVEYRKLGLREVYSRLYGADTHLIPKGWTWRVVVSSTLYQTMASATPIVVPDTRYFEAVPPTVVIKYWGVRDLARKLSQILDDPGILEKYKRALIEYCNRFSVERIVHELVELAKDAPTPYSISSWPGRVD
jgi:glycosyltransferase involved in cell wall biosynthesis